VAGTGPRAWGSVRAFAHRVPPPCRLSALSRPVHGNPPDCRYPPAQSLGGAVALGRRRRLHAPDLPPHRGRGGRPASIIWNREKGFVGAVLPRLLVPHARSAERVPPLAGSTRAWALVRPWLGPDGARRAGRRRARGRASRERRGLARGRSRRPPRRKPARSRAAVPLAVPLGHRARSRSVCQVKRPGHHAVTGP